MARKPGKTAKTKQQATESTTLGDLVDRHPEAVPVLFSHGLHCIGCHFAATETIGQGCKAHGMDANGIRALLKDVNAAIKEAAHRPAIMLTPVAATALKGVMKASKKKGGLRVIAIETGPGQLAYDLAIEEKPNKDDEVLEHRGVKMFVDKQSLRKARGCTIDYLEHKQGFAVRRN